MARTTLCKTNIVTDYVGRISVASLHSGDPGTTGTGELAGGSPAYARKAPTFGTITTSASGLALFDVESSDEVGGGGLWDDSANFLEGGALPTVTFVSQGKYQLTINVTAGG